MQSTLPRENAMRQDEGSPARSFEEFPKGKPEPPTFAPERSFGLPSGTMAPPSSAANSDGSGAVAPTPLVLQSAEDAQTAVDVKRFWQAYQPQQSQAERERERR